MTRPVDPVKAVSDVAVAALRCAPGVNALQVVTEGVLASIGADGCLYETHASDGVSRISTHAPFEMWDSLPVNVAPTAAATTWHPAMDRLVNEPSNDVLTVTDCISAAAWRHNEFARLLQPHWGLSLQLAIPVMRSPDSVNAWVLTRDGVDYSWRDRQVATAMQPVLDVVGRHAALAATAGPAPLNCPLTQRELLVLRLLSDGLGACAIAHLLAVSPRTVHKHLEHVYRKLDVRDRLLAVRRGHELGLLGPAR